MTVNRLLSASTLADVVKSADTIWILIGAALVFFMQAGFAMVEAGLTRAKNSGNIIMKNLMDFCLGTLVFWVLGYGLMHGKDIAGLFGIPTIGWATAKIDYVHLIFQTVFCATAATIVSGAMAERTKFNCYCIYSLVISLFVYPVSGHWIWGGGFLARLGFHDFAGSTAVHMVGGVSALIGAIFLGPRLGKYGKDGKPRAIPGHNLTIAALGVFILWFCWFGFNGASTYGVFDANGASISDWMGQIFVTTNLAPATAATVCMIVTWVKYRKPDVSICLNGALAGLVGVTAGCDTVTPVGAFIIGVVCGFAVIFGVELLDNKLKIDDPVGAVAVHGICGALGTLMTGILSADSGLWAAATGKVSWGEGFRFLGIQTLGVVCVAAWVTATMTLTFFLLKKFLKLRVPAREEIGGLDLFEHNLATAYAGFSVADHTGEDIPTTNDSSRSAPSPAIKETKIPTASKNAKLTKVSLVINPSRFEELKTAMNAIGITGMTATQVMGCGMQKGSTELYRGAPMEVTLLPKVKVEIVVSAVPVETVIETAEKVLQTGNYGDGKIFVYDVEDVIKIRTGERGYDALQDNRA